MKIRHRETKRVAALERRRNFSHRARGQLPWRKRPRDKTCGFNSANNTESLFTITQYAVAITSSKVETILNFLRICLWRYTGWVSQMFCIEASGEMCTIVWMICPSILRNESGIMDCFFFFLLNSAIFKKKIKNRNSRANFVEPAVADWRPLTPLFRSRALPPPLRRERRGRNTRVTYLCILWYSYVY